MLTDHRRYYLSVLLILLGVIGLLAANPQAKVVPPAVPGWVVLQRDSTGDDTRKLQAAIDRVAESGGGCVFLPTGTYRTRV